MPPIHRESIPFLASAIAFLGLFLAPTATAAQLSAADSTEALKEMRELQRDFEEYRESRTRIQSGTRDGRCDERIGRICIWFGGDDEEAPPELQEVRIARARMISSMVDTFGLIKDRWILGQIVHYLVENQAVEEAQRFATTCGIVEAWWCAALRGYVLHVWTKYVDSEAAFREALAEMPLDVYEEWTSFRYILTPSGRDRFEKISPADREREWELFWRLSDPLFLMEGNDRLTDHFARLVIAENRREAADPLAIEWGEDLEETLVRYGRNTGYSRDHDPQAMFRTGPLDTRRMVGHHHPFSRGYLFPEDFLEAPSEIPAETWITAPREARTWYAPPYAPDIRPLETQLGRFRRDDAMLVVGAYRPLVPSEKDEDEMVDAWEPGDEATPYAALFLVPETGEAPIFVRGSDPEGVLTLEAPPGRYVSGMEVVNLDIRRAWRARQGIQQLPLSPGAVDASDLMILAEGAPLPETLEEGLEHVRPGFRLRRGERFPVMWEMYGLRVEEPVRITIGFSRGRPGFLERVGTFMGVIEPEEDIDVTFEDAGPDAIQTVFRSIELTMPALAPGEYTLHLRIELPGRTPLVKSRPIVVQ